MGEDAGKANAVVVSWEIPDEAQEGTPEEAQRGQDKASAGPVMKLQSSAKAVDRQGGPRNSDTRKPRTRVPAVSNNHRH